jgi:shikimate kinase
MTRLATDASLPPNLFLIGYRATGKSKVARLLAQELGWQSVDADAMLESRAGMSIRELFQSEGEAGFRRRENALLEEICRKRGQVVATGGGVVLAAQNRDLLAKNGVCVLLEADAATIERRMRADPATAERRPALTVGGLAEIESLLGQRGPLYELCASARFAVADRTPEQVAEAILAWLGTAR